MLFFRNFVLPLLLSVTEGVFLLSFTLFSSGAFIFLTSSASFLPPSRVFCSHHHHALFSQCRLPIFLLAGSGCRIIFISFSMPSFAPSLLPSLLSFFVPYVSSFPCSFSPSHSFLTFSFFHSSFFPIFAPTFLLLHPSFLPFLILSVSGSILTSLSFLLS